MMEERCDRRSSGLETMTTGPRSPDGMARSSRNAWGGAQGHRQRYTQGRETGIYAVFRGELEASHQFLRGRLAQLIEPPTLNRQVAGSSPRTGTITCPMMFSPHIVRHLV